LAAGGGGFKTKQNNTGILLPILPADSQIVATLEFAEKATPIIPSTLFSSNLT
jgi:hypothetical protein